MTAETPHPKQSRPLILRYPLLLVVLGHCLFSLGLWKAEIGFGEDTVPIRTALTSVKEHTLNSNAYIDLYALILGTVAPDPMQAAVVMRFLVSLFTAISLYLVLSRFSDRLKIEAILFATFVWIACRLNAPLVVFTNVNGFSFAIMLLGIYALFSPRRGWGLAGFVFFSGLAISLRPEWIAPFGLIALFLVGNGLWSWLRRSQGVERRNKVIALAVCLVVGLGVLMALTSRLQAAARKGDEYLLLGLGQCYASFLKAEHPEQKFDAMTEFQGVLDRTFGHPKTMMEAVHHNPQEFFRYLRGNTTQNLRRIPEELLSTHAGHNASLLARPHSLLLYLVLFGGGACAVVNFLQRRKSPAPAGKETALRLSVAKRAIVLLLFSSASSVAVVLLVGSPRYWISIVPLVYLVMAFCGDGLLRRIDRPIVDYALVLAAFACFCWPNFLHLKGENVEVRAMRTVAPRVRPHPVIGALWGDPLAVYGFRGEAVAVSAWDGIKAEDIAAGHIDILLINRGFRDSRTYATQQAFFESFEKDPTQFGFQKLDGIEMGPRVVYYRPAGAVK